MSLAFIDGECSLEVSSSTEPGRSSCMPAETAAAGAAPLGAAALSQPQLLLAQPPPPRRQAAKSSQYRGVIAGDEARTAWRARIRHGRFTIHLGRCALALYVRVCVLVWEGEGGQEQGQRLRALWLCLAET